MLYSDSNGRANPQIGKFEYSMVPALYMNAFNLEGCLCHTVSSDQRWEMAEGPTEYGTCLVNMEAILFKLSGLLMRLSPGLYVEIPILHLAISSLFMSSGTLF